MPLRYDFENSIGYWLVTTSAAYERAINEELTPEGITFRQAQVLGYLALDGRLGQSELAERMRVEAPTLTGILDRMERDGWLRRVADPADRRRKVIEPTAAAEPVWSRVAACARRVRAKAAEGLTDAERRQLRALLSKVRDNLTLAESPEKVDACSAATRS